MNAKKIITLAVVVTMIGWAPAFMTSEALAQWSDGGPEMFPLTYPSKESVVEREAKIADAPVDHVESFDALTLWSDGGPERFPLTYPAKADAMDGETCLAKDSETSLDGISDQLVMR